MVQEYPIQFDKYLLLERIAVGGMAEVFKAIYRTIEGVEKVVALKRILPEYSLDEEFVSLFIDEARISATLQHPNIVHVFDFGKIDRSHYIAMEYVDGPNLKNFMRRLYQEEDEFPIEFSIYIIIQMLKALDYLHRATDSSNRPLYVIHRDISPQNILLSREGEVKITDFGIAKAASKLSKTVPGKIQGKFGYMSPEQAKGKELDHRSDLFSLGIIFFEMLTGKRLYGGENTFVRYENVKEAKVQPVSKYRDVPEALDRIVTKMLQKNPDDRYQRSGDLQRDLTDILYPANTETVITSLSESINRYFPKVVSKDPVDKSFPKRQVDDEKEKKASKSSSERETKTLTMLPEEQEEKSVSKSGSKSKKSPPKKKREKEVSERRSIADEKGGERSKSKSVRERSSSQNVVELHTRENIKRAEVTQRRDFNSGGVRFAKALMIAMFAIAGFLALQLGLGMAGVGDGGLLGGVIDGGPSRKDLGEQLKKTQEEAKLLKDTMGEREFELQRLRQQLDDLESQRGSLDNKFGDAEDRLRRVEKQFNRAQDDWDKERKSYINQLAALNAKLAKATEKCPDGMIYVAASKFLFGSAESDPERNLGEKVEAMVSSKGFCIDKYEFPNKAKQTPKAAVAWSQAQQSCESERKRLCSEKEWERACKGPSNNRYAYGNNWKESSCNTELKDGKDRAIQTSGGLKSCVTGENVFDMSGNVAEWTMASDASSASRAVVKGGSFDRAGYWSRCASRLEAVPTTKSGSIGFRCCRDPR